MKLRASIGDDNIATVYILEAEKGRLIECAESVQPPRARAEKWVLLVSTLLGCPIGCAMCDAGGFYQGKLAKAEILGQIDFLIRRRFPYGRVPCRQFKIQFARMGEPSLNPAVLAVLEELPDRYDAPGLIPALSTVAPAGTHCFFERLLDIKRRFYGGSRFQFQFSVHTTDQALRDRLVPVKTWTLAEMARYGQRFFAPGDREIVLNFPLVHGFPIEPGCLLEHFDPQKFIIKITPLNPTHRAAQNRLRSHISATNAPSADQIVQALRVAGYQVIVSVGAPEESRIGSNCGQYVRAHLAASAPIPAGYTYPIRMLARPPASLR